MKEHLSSSTYTGLVNPHSTAIRVMDELQITSCVQIYLPGGSDDQREELQSYIGSHVLCRVPLPIGCRQFIFCRHDANFTDDCILNDYQTILTTVFGSNTRAHARIYRKGGVL